jgi:TonB family protein
VFSGRANAFGEKDVDALRELARRVALDKKEADEGALHPAVTVASAVAGTANDKTAEPPAQEGSIEPDPTRPTVESVSPEEAAAAKANDVWTTVLVVLVIAVAVTLGLVIGRRRAAMARDSAALNVAEHQVAGVAANHPTPEGTAEPAAVARATPPQAGDSVPNSVSPNSVPAGGLIVTENGKVIYKIEPAKVAPTAARRTPEQSPANRIIHWVQPEYPAQATAQGIQGPVVLDVRIEGDGTVGSVDVVSGNPLLADAAVSAVKQWVYAPFPGGGKAERQTRVTIRFTLP